MRDKQQWPSPSSFFRSPFPVAGPTNKPGGACRCTLAGFAADDRDGKAIKTRHDAGAQPWPGPALLCCVRPAGFHLAGSPVSAACVPTHLFVDVDHATR
jgi:hypothetical protein